MPSQHERSDPRTRHPANEDRFGRLLRELRVASGRTQRQLADEVGVDFTYLSKIENEKLPPPSEEKILVIARVLKQEPDRLLRAARRVPADFQARLEELPPEASVILHRMARGNLTREQFKAMLRATERGSGGAGRAQTGALHPGRRTRKA